MTAGGAPAISALPPGPAPRGSPPDNGTDAEGAFGGRWHGPSIVLTHDARAVATDADVTFVGDLATAFRVAKEAARGK